MLPWALLSLLAIQCMDTPLEPVAPTSDLQLSIPLINRIKYIQEFASKDSLLKRTSDGGFIYEASTSVQPIGIDTIRADPEPSFQVVRLGTFAIETPPPTGDTLSYKEITGSDPPPVPVILPPQTFSLPSIFQGPASSFENVTFESGTLTLRVRNRFPVPISFPDPIILKNNKTSSPVDTSEVARFSFGAQVFQPGEERSQTASLANVTVRNVLRVPSFRMRSLGSGTPVTVTPQSGLEYSMSFSSLIAQSARARIPSQNVVSVRDSVFTVDDSVTIQSATFRRGGFDIVLQNNVDVTMSMFISFKELKNRATGAEFTVNHTFNGKGTLRIPVNVRDLKVESASTALGTRVTFSAGIQTIESQNLQQVNSTDFFRADIQPTSSFVMESITGRIKPTSVAVNSGASGPDLGEASDKFKGNFTFDSVRVTLNVGLTGGFPSDYNFRFIAMNRRVSPAKIDSLVVPPPQGSTIRRIYPGPNKSTQIVLDNSTGLNRFFSKFFPYFPDTFIVRGTALMNPPDVFPTSQGIQSIYDTTKLYASVNLSFPLKMAIEGGEVTDTVDIGSGEKFPREFVKSVKSGTMYFEVSNGLPVQLTLQSALLGKNAAGRRDTLLRIPTDGIRVITAAEVDQGGSTVGPKVSSFSVRLTGPEIDKFNDADAMWFRLQVETTGGGKVPVKVRSSDFVHIRASANMVYTINKP